MNKAKLCQNCRGEFIIELEDFSFYEKIKVPPPTWCPACRFLRRMSWRNERYLFKKKDESTGEEIFSQFSPDSYVKIYNNKYWNSDKWDPMDYGREYDFKKDFFTQIRELLGDVPMEARSVINMVNSDYCMNSINLKNCYLVRASTYTEDSAYLVWDSRSKASFDLYMTDSCELSYSGTNLKKCYKTFFSVDCESCNNVMFSRNCIGCTDCFGCSNLRNKKFHIFNKQYTKEEYFKELQKFDTGSWSSLNQLLSKSRSSWLENPVMFMHSRHNSDVTGDYIYESKRVFDSYRIIKMENSKYCQNILNGPAYDCFDYSNWGEGAELIYESIGCGGGASNLKFCFYCYVSIRDVEYSIYCLNSSNLFACVGLRNKQYCILNKQYTKEEYRELIPKIIEHMSAMPYVDKKGKVYKYGEFFPVDLSPNKYNISVTQDDFPLTKEQVIEEGYSWHDDEERNYKITLNSKDIPDHIEDIQDSILAETVGCEHDQKCNEQCSKAFKLIPQELQFYRQMNLPLPRLCPNCRHGQRIKEKNPFGLWDRKCACAGLASENQNKTDHIYQNQAGHFHKEEHCPNAFKTSYAPDRPEIVYCEQCYNSEVA